MWNLESNKNSDFSKTLASFFVENEKWAYEATIYRYENWLDELSHLSDIIKISNPTKQELKKLKEDLKIMEKNIISYFSNIFTWDLTKINFPIPLTPWIRIDIEEKIFYSLSAFMIKTDLEKYKLNEEWYVMKIKFIKSPKWETRLWKINVYEDKEVYDKLKK